MTFCGRQYPAASPVVAIKPSSSHQSHLSTSSLARDQAPFSAPSVSVGKKRARDEASHNLDCYATSPTAETAHEGWRSIRRPDSPFLAQARNHSGDERQEKSLGPRRPELRSCKSQRIDPTFQQTPSTNGSIGLGRLSTQTAPAESSKELIIDDFTLHLGIGWRRLSGDQHVQAAARGWARFIGNNFALTDVRMCLESKALQSYLVEAAEGFFLFAENLRQGRLVSRTVDGALRNLQASPPIFDGTETLTMEARDRPSPGEPAADSEMKID